MEPNPPNGSPQNSSQPLENYQANSPTASWVFGGLILFFLMFVVFVPVESNKFPIIRFLMALSAAFFAIFFVGGVLLRGTLKGLFISATGGFVLFVLIQFVFDPFRVLPNASTPPMPAPTPTPTNNSSAPTSNKDKSIESPTPPSGLTLGRPSPQPTSSESSHNTGQGDLNWEPISGEWKVSGNNLFQLNDRIKPAIIIAKSVNKPSYAVTFVARCLSGDDGLMAIFNFRDEQNYIWWNIGGYGNTLSLMECKVKGTGYRMNDTNSPFTLKGGRWYTVKVIIDGSHFQGYIDDDKKFDTNIPPEYLSPGYFGLRTWGTSVEFRDVKVK